jgi:pyridoxamine 5'-phosphate oxidase family protein
MSVHGPGAVQLVCDLVQHPRRAAPASVRPLLEQRRQLILERLDEPAGKLSAVGRQGDHGRTSVALVGAPLDPASLNGAVDEVRHVRPIASQRLREAADSGRLHRRAEQFGLGSSQAVRAARPQIRVLESHPQAPEGARDCVGRLVHTAIIKVGDGLTYFALLCPIREMITYWKGQRMSSVFTEAELAYLNDGRRLGRIATVGKDGTPHVVPSGWVHNPELDTIDVTGRAVDETKKFRDVARSGRAAIVIDDIAGVNPWRPRAIEVRGRAEAVLEPEPLIRIHPERIVAWGIDDQRLARTVLPASSP